MEIEIYGQKFEIEVPGTDEKLIALLLRPLMYYVQHLTEERVTGKAKEIQSLKAKLTAQDFQEVLQNFADGSRRFPQFIGAYAIGVELGQQDLSVPFVRPTFTTGWSTGDIASFCMRISKEVVKAIKATTESEKPQSCLSEAGAAG